MRITLFAQIIPDNKLRVRVHLARMSQTAAHQIICSKKRASIENPLTNKSIVSFSKRKNVRLVKKLDILYKERHIKIMLIVSQSGTIWRRGAGFQRTSSEF